MLIMLLASPLPCQFQPIRNLDIIGGFRLVQLTSPRPYGRVDAKLFVYSHMVLLQQKGEKKYDIFIDPHWTHR